MRTNLFLLIKYILVQPHSQFCIIGYFAVLQAMQTLGASIWLSSGLGKRLFTVVVTKVFYFFCSDPSMVRNVIGLLQEYVPKVSSYVIFIGSGQVVRWEDIKQQSGRDTWWVSDTHPTLPHQLLIQTNGSRTLPDTWCQALFSEDRACDQG